MKSHCDNLVNTEVLRSACAAIRSAGRSLDPIWGVAIMKITAILLRWYRSFNTTSLGPNDPVPSGRWNEFNGQVYPFVVVPLDHRITSVVGANESGKSHLLSALSKVVRGDGLPATVPDKYEIKDVCRYCGFAALDEVWPEIGIQLSVTATEAQEFEAERDESIDQHNTRPEKTEQSTNPSARVEVTVILNGTKKEKFATVYRGDVLLRTFEKKDWTEFATEKLPSIEFINASLGLPNEIHIDELLDAYESAKPQPVVDPLGVQDLWREVASIEVEKSVEAPNIERISDLKKRISKSTRKPIDSELQLVTLLFRDVLGVRGSDLQRMREYTNTEQGYVSWLVGDINDRIDRELDIARYWEQDEDFTLSVSYHKGTFHFQITDRTGSTFTFNERSSGLRYFLSYYIQAKALEKKFGQRGVLILMDEPDSFLSASGQRSLLRVFEELVGRKSGRESCQLIYTTHSPFLINRNFPNRVRLVRKGDGAEGTQFVTRSAVRRFEPVRTALSIDAADTLFLGSTNVMLEGYTDLKLITSVIQRFGEPGRLDEVLDLNSVTLVAAGGAGYAPEMVAKALKGDEKPPVVVVLLDGDSSGQDAVAKIAKLIDPKQVSTLSEVAAGSQVFQVLEDIVPIELLDAGIQAYARRLGLTLARPFDGSSLGSNSAERVVQFCREHLSNLSPHEDFEIRAGVIDALTGLLDDETFHTSSLGELFDNVRELCKHVNTMIEHAQRNAGRRSLKSLVRQQVDIFRKRFPLGASKADLRKLLEDIKHVAFGHAAEFEQTRINIDRFLAKLDTEAAKNSDSIQLDLWIARLERFKNEPWVKNAGLEKEPKPVADTSQSSIGRSAGGATVPH